MQRLGHLFSQSPFAPPPPKMASLTASLRTSLQRVGRGLAGAPRSAQRVARAFSFDSLSEVLGKSHSEAYQESIRHPESFWGELARKRLRWTRPFVKTLECDFKAGRIRWFEGGSLNVSGEDRRPGQVWKTTSGREGLAVLSILYPSPGHPQPTRSWGSPHAASAGLRTICMS